MSDAPSSDPVADDARRVARRYGFATAAVVVLFLALDAAWMSRYGWLDRPPAIDASWFRIDAQRMLNAWRDGGFGAFLTAAGGRLHASHPPFLTGVAAVVAKLRGTDVEPLDCWLAVRPFVVLFLWGAHRLARRVLGPRAAWAAAALVATSPVVVVNARPFYQQLPAAALVLWAWDALARSDRFARLGPALAFGLWGGLACLMKSIAPVYLAGGVVAAVAGALRREDRGRAARHAAAALGVLLVVAAPWYLRHWEVVADYAGRVVGRTGQEVWSRNASFADLARWTYYPLRFADGGVGLVLAAMAVVVGLRAVVVRTGPTAVLRERLGAISPALWSSLGAWVLLSLGQVSGDAYYVQGLVPPVVVVVAAGVSLFAPRARRAATALLCAGAAFNLWAATRTPDADKPLATWGPVALAPTTDPIFSRYAPESGVDPRRGSETWPDRAYMREILLRATREVPVVAMTSQNLYSGQFQLPFEAARHRRDVVVVAPTADQLYKNAWDTFEPVLRGADFLLVHRYRRPFGPPLELCRGFVERLGLEFEVVAEAEVTPDYGSTLVRLGLPRRLGGCVTPAAAALRPQFRALDAEHAAGWRLRGVAAETAPDGAPLRTAFFAFDAARGRATAELVVRDAAGATRTRTAPLTPPPTALVDDRTWFAVTFEVEPGFGAAGLERTELATRAFDAAGRPISRVATRL